MKWRRTVINNQWRDNDWVIQTPGQDTIARIYLAPQGHWHWGAHPPGVKGKSGFADSGKEAREAAEAVLKSAGIEIER